MFESQSFFKSIQCPYYSQTTNTLNCERAYCPFKHVNLNQQKDLTNQQTTSISINKNQTDTTIKDEIKATATTITQSIENKEKGTKDLPTALENLSNALQTFQELIKQNQSNTTSQHATNNIDLSSTIVSQLNNLSNVILSNVSTQPTQPESTQSNLNRKSSSSSLTNTKKTQSFPEYNPTPIKQLKKIKENEIDEKVTYSQLKRKDLISSKESLDDSSSLNVKKIKTENESFDPINKITKSSSSSSLNQEVKSGDESTPNSKSKLDLVSFSKLSVNQQMLKRYEILNKEPPTAASINQAKFKKRLETSNLSTSALSTDKKQDPNVPHLIMDTSSNATPKVPLMMRQKYLKVIFDNCKPLYQPIKLACDKAAENEKSIYDKSKNKQIYMNLVANTIKSLRSELVQLQLNNSNNIKKEDTLNTSSPSSNTKTSKIVTNLPNKNSQIPLQNQTYSHEALLNGSKVNRISYSINKNKQIEYKDLSVTQLYQMFYTYILSEKQLDDNSFPKWMNPNEINAKKRLAYIPNFTQQSRNSTEKQTKPSTTFNTDQPDSKLITKTCKRCNKNFYLHSNDLSYFKENNECVYHWGKLRSVRVNKSIEQKFSCCSGGPNSEGCEEGKHVYDGDYDGNGLGTHLTDYVETIDPSTPLDLLHSKSSKNIYALDCEMCYTTKGLEVTRVSIVDIHCKIVYESLVKPDADILDYNTRWSGLTENSLKNCNKKLSEVQAELLRLINKDTVLIGHSLDSDFKALKLIHKNVIDTSVVFPHKMGPPFKRALRNLMSEYLQRIIQEDSEGHDSKEDATSCVQLMIWKINEDLKSNKQLCFLQHSQSHANFQINNIPMTPTMNGLNKSPIKLTQTSSLSLSQVKAKMAENQQKQQQKTNINLVNKTNISSLKIINSK